MPAARNNSSCVVGSEVSKLISSLIGQIISAASLISIINAPQSVRGAAAKTASAIKRSWHFSQASWRK
jgi:hypothetical protein